MSSWWRGGRRESTGEREAYRTYGCVPAPEVRIAL
jgi:hypothetical protein